jgi:crossover junction endodeoxyribonuclease RuvC
MEERKRIHRKEYTILGLDLSLTSTGWCILDNDEILDVEVIKCKDKAMKRLWYIKYIIDEVTVSLDFDLVVVEGYSMGSRGGRVFSIGELGGIIKLLLYEEKLRTKLKTVIIPPKSLKKFITGNGNAGKELMLLKTYKKYGIEFTDNNKCDAFGLAKMGQAYLEGTNIEYEKEALKKVEELV